MSIYGLSLGNDDDWTDYVRARTTLGDPIDLRPVYVDGNMRSSLELYPWEREILLPVVRPLLIEWVANNTTEGGGR